MMTGVTRVTVERIMSTNSFTDASVLRPEAVKHQRLIQRDNVGFDGFPASEWLGGNRFPGA